MTFIQMQRNTPIPNSCDNFLIVHPPLAKAAGTLGKGSGRGRGSGVRLDVKKS